MTVENENTRVIGNDQLLEDIANTEKELRAYQHLEKGFNLLTQLPESRDWDSECECTHLRLLFENQIPGAKLLLQTLLAIAKERGLPYVR